MKRGSVVEHETPHQARVHTTAEVVSIVGDCPVVVLHGQAGGVQSK
jgi:hypothetical protein